MSNDLSSLIKKIVDVDGIQRKLNLLWDFGSFFVYSVIVCLVVMLS